MKSRRREGAVSPKKVLIKLTLVLEETLIIGVVVLINVAFLTLLERKILGLSQLRVGPNKVGV